MAAVSYFKLSHSGMAKVRNVPADQLADGELPADLTDFGYMFDDLSASTLRDADPAAVKASMELLADSMAEGDQGLDVAATPPDDQDPPANNSNVPPVYTYWGQFIDHDLTANTDRDMNDVGEDIFSSTIINDPSALDRDTITTRLKNIRRPEFDLDSLYGPGHRDGEDRLAMKDDDGVHMLIGEATDLSPFNLPNSQPGLGFNRDLPRNIRPDGTIIDDSRTSHTGDDRLRAIIGDGRNEENLIVGQFHLGMLRFHNAVCDWVAENEPMNSSHPVSHHERAKNLTQYHYQWLVVNDYLKTVLKPGVVDRILLTGPRFYAKKADEAFMPIEYSVAAFRFGHSMVRAVYDFNELFGRIREDSPFNDIGSFDNMFGFTANGQFSGRGNTLPGNWMIDWDRFVHKGDGDPNRFARRIDANLAFPLKDLRNEAVNEQDARIKALLRHLAHRNLLRGYVLDLPSGQSVASKMGIEPLTPDELTQGSVVAQTALQANDNLLLNNTPLWYYILKESEVRENGQFLGAVGSEMVAETMISMLAHDNRSYLNDGTPYDGGPVQTGASWSPADGVKFADGRPITTIGDLLEFAGVKKSSSLIA